MVEKDGAIVRVMAGASLGTDGPIAMRNPGLLLDVSLSPGAKFTQKVQNKCAVVMTLVVASGFDTRVWGVASIEQQISGVQQSKWR